MRVKSLSHTSPGALTEAFDAFFNSFKPATVRIEHIAQSNGKNENNQDAVFVTVAYSVLSPSA